MRYSLALIVAHFAGKMLSVLDGVPLAVKDDIDCLPHPSTGAESLRKLVSTLRIISLELNLIFAKQPICTY